MSGLIDAVDDVSGQIARVLGEGSGGTVASRATVHVDSRSRRDRVA